MKILDTLKDKFKKNAWVMKGLAAFLLFVLVISFSWYYFSSRPSESDKSKQEETYQFIQDQFQLMVADLVKKQKTKYKQTVFHNIRIEDSSADLSALKVFFHYSLIEEAGDETRIKGEAEIRKSLDEEDLWIVTNFQVTDSFLEFTEPMIIKGSPSSDSADPDSTPVSDSAASDSDPDSTPNPDSAP